MSNLDECNRYLDEIKGRADLTHDDLVRTAVERGWGSFGACYLLGQHFRMPLSEAARLTDRLRADYGFHA